MYVFYPSNSNCDLVVTDHKPVGPIVNGSFSVRPIKESGRVGVHHVEGVVGHECRGDTYQSEVGGARGSKCEYS